MKYAVLISILVSIGCKSEEAANLEKLAARTNPVIEKLRPNVAIVLQPGADPKAVRMACLQAIADSLPLAGLMFDDRRRDDDPVGINDVLAGFTTALPANDCKEDTGDGTRDARCVRFCTEQFRELSDAFGRFHSKHPEFETLTK